MQQSATADICMQADRSGKVLIEKLRNTIKVCPVSVLFCVDALLECVQWCVRSGHSNGINIVLCVQEFELTIDLDVMLAELDKEQSGSIDYKEFKSLLD